MGLIINLKLSGRKSLLYIFNLVHRIWSRKIILHPMQTSPHDLIILFAKKNTNYDLYYESYFQVWEIFINIHCLKSGDFDSMSISSVLIKASFTVEMGDLLIAMSPRKCVYSSRRSLRAIFSSALWGLVIARHEWEWQQMQGLGFGRPRPLRMRSRHRAENSGGIPECKNTICQLFAWKCEIEYENTKRW